MTGTLPNAYVQYDYFQRLTLESWYTKVEQMPLTRRQPLRAPYKRLVPDVNENEKNGLLYI